MKEVARLSLVLTLAMVIVCAGTVLAEPERGLSDEEMRAVLGRNTTFWQEQDAGPCFPGPDPGCQPISTGGSYHVDPTTVQRNCTCVQWSWGWSTCQEEGVYGCMWVRAYYDDNCTDRWPEEDGQLGAWTTCVGD